MFNWNKMLLISLLMWSTLISVTSHSWLGIWMGLEINLMSFIPLIVENKNMLISEAMLSYFMVQTLTSINLLFFIIMTKMNPNLQWLTQSIMNLSLMMKMGAAPFHFWFPKVMSGLSWSNCFILSTWQKITPMIAISFCMNTSLVMISIFLSALVGAIGGINQTSIRVMMSFSSISHMSWMLSSMLISLNLWSIYFLIYSILNSMMMYLFSMNNFFFLSQMFSTKLNSFMFLSINLNMLSLGGLPPFLGFFPKWLVIYYMSINNMFLLTIFLTMMTLITLSFYMNVMFSGMIISYSQNKWFNNFKNFKATMFIYAINSISFFSLLVISFMNMSF
uniref:NADH dehydrogenase subunit 2 n=1 Tax=Himalopsyche malenanda TaxID=2598966 RepID=UPI0022DCDE15|nr:NADH dehydrogenase subunit 2 [Himalopsyche malenanda]UZZ44000.1 NADH dehydrogenase subunit 2 [Himalopsyche malenanda]